MIDFKNSKLIELLSLFEEGVFLDLSYSGKDLNLKLECSYLASQINESFSCFYLVLKKCSNFSFQPWDEEMMLISDVKELRLLKPDILSVEEFDDETVKVYSNCCETFTGGNLFISAADILVYDEELNPVSLEQLQALSENYWYSDRGAQG